MNPILQPFVPGVVYVKLGAERDLIELALGALTHHVSRRVSADLVETYEEIYPPLAPNALIAGTPDPRFANAWRLASAESFQPLVAQVATVEPAVKETGALETDMAKA